MWSAFYPKLNFVGGRERWLNSKGVSRWKKTKNSIHESDMRKSEEKNESGLQFNVEKAGISVSASY